MIGLIGWKIGFTWIPVLKKSSCGGRVERDECGLYVKLLYAYLREYVCVSDLSVGQQPYRSSLFHYSWGL